MSQYYWQNALQTTPQQCGSQERNDDTGDGTRWSNVGLCNESTNEKPQQQQPYWWSQQNEVGADLYSAAAFEGIRASSGNGSTNGWQTAQCYTVYPLGQQEQTALSMGKYAYSGNVPHENEQPRPLFGIHQPILDSKRAGFINNATAIADVEKLGTKDSGQQDKVLIDDRRKGNELVDMMPTKEKEQLESIREPDNGVPTVAVAQVTPMIATSLAATVETPDVQYSGNMIYAQSYACIPSPVNVARVGPISSQQNDSLGFSVNRVAPTMHPAVFSNPQSPSVVPVTGSAHDTPESFIEETGETQNTITAPVLQVTANTITTTNLQRPDTTGSPVTEQELVSTSASVQLKEAMNVSANPPHSGSIQETLGRNESGAPQQEESREQSAPLLTSAEQSTDSAAVEDSVGERTSGMHKDSRNVRDRYRIIRQQYPEVVKRLDRLRMETRGLDWRSVQRAASLEVGENFNPSMPNRVHKNPAAPVGFDSSASADLKGVEPALDSRPSSKMNHSYTLPERMSSEDGSMKNDVFYYGEDFVNSLRRIRHARARDLDYFWSRDTKSEMGEVGPYRGPALAVHKQYMMQHAYGYNSSAGYASHEFYPSGRQSLGPYLGRRTAHELALCNEDTLPRRPQSSFDASAYAKYQHLNEFVQDSHQKDRVDHSSENEDESSGSDSEIARIHYEQEMTRRAAAMRYNAMQVAAPNEFYYFGVIQLPQERVEHIMYRMPPPPEYFQLPPIEKAAYLFYCVLYQHHYQPVDLFHKKFNREYFNYMCEGDSAEIALWKICKHTQEEFIAQRSANQLKAYEMSQKQLFSDDRETLDSRDLAAPLHSTVLIPYMRSKSEPLQSERGSRCDAEDESDRLSVDSALREPMKFRVAHSFLRFAAGGKIILLNVESSENILEIRDLKSLIGDHKLLRICNAIESFRGPLITGYTPTHSVRLYVQRQIELILKSEAYRSNPSGGVAGDCLLIWQLLEMLVQQQGRVTGPDLSRLLMTGCHVAEHRRHIKEKTNSVSPANFTERLVDPKAYDRFTQLLLGGHIKEALDSAVKDGLYSDAMILARRICASEPQELEKVEAAFLSHRSEQNPVMTLLSVANGQPAPFLTSPPLDEANSWRSHAAIVLANINTPAALGTVYQLGRVLAHRELHAAADFCFLAVSLLAPGYNPFQPLPKSEDENADARQHITLIHATSDDEMSLECPKGFSVIDLHATEIFEYATKLANVGVPVSLSGSVAYQLCRLDYAEMISELGSSAADAYRYCFEIAKGIWEQCHEIDVEELERLYELAERLKFVASADANSTAWLPAMLSLINERRRMTEVKPSDVKRDVTTPSDLNYSEEDHGLTMVTKVSPKTSAAEGLAENSGDQSQGVENIKTLDSAAIEWHVGHQEPITIASVSSKEQEVECQKPESNEYRMQPGQLHERVRTHNSSNASVHTSQYSTVPPTPAVSMNDSPESSSTTRTIPQASERISPNAVRGYYDSHLSNETKYSTQERRSDMKGDSDPQTEVTTDDSTTAASSHESTPRRNLDYLEKKLPDEMTSAVAAGNQSEGLAQLAYVPSAAQNIESNQQNYVPECSVPSQQRTSTVKKDEKTNNKSKIVNENRQNSGIFSKLKATIAKAIPSSHEMILPDDKNPSIVWDPKLNRYVGEGVEEEPVPEPPPSVTPSSEKLNGSAHSSVGGLTAARLSGGSRYFNPLAETTSSKPSMHAAPIVPPVPLPAQFGFIPSMPDSDDAPAESPFSIDTGPQPQGAEVAE